MRVGFLCLCGWRLLIDAHGSAAPLGETEPDCMHIDVGHLCNLQQIPVASGLPLVSRVSHRFEHVCTDTKLASTLLVGDGYFH
jgi:hypothetical protein